MRVSYIQNLRVFEVKQATTIPDELDLTKELQMINIVDLEWLKALCTKIDAWRILPRQMGLNDISKFGSNFYVIKLQICWGTQS